MSSSCGRSVPPGPAHGGEPAAGPSDSFYCFLRYSHVLSSILREMLEERFLAELGGLRLNRSQFCSLKLIALNADLRVGELAHCLGVTSAASSKNIDKLERLGLVCRGVSPDDRRVALITASDEGQRLVRRYEELKAARIAPVVEGLGGDFVDELCHLLEQVCVRLLAEERTARGPCLRCAGYYRADCSLASVRGRCALRQGRAGAVRRRQRPAATRSAP